MNDLIDKMDSVEIVDAKEMLPTEIKTAQEDFDYSQEKIKGIIETGEGVLEHAADIAKETGEPRAIEVFSQLAKNLGDLAKSVMENNKIKSAIRKDHADIVNPQKNTIPGSLTQTNNTIFVGSAAELLNMVDEQQLKVIEQIQDESTDIKSE